MVPSAGGATTCSSAIRFARPSFSTSSLDTLASSSEVSIKGFRAWVTAGNGVAVSEPPPCAHAWWGARYKPTANVVCSLRIVPYQTVPSPRAGALAASARSCNDVAV
eukprot:356731-Chlamydomonas_euryale.AAC.6